MAAGAFLCYFSCVKKRTLKRIILFLFLLALAFGFRHLWVRLPIINGYAAKNLCSCVFVAGREAASVEHEELDYSFVKYASSTVDTVQQLVTSSFFGMRNRRAKFYDGFGCINVGDEVLQLRPARKIDVVNSFPESVSPSKELQEALNNHFADAKCGTRAVVVLKNGQLVAEQYARGFTKDTRQLGWSMTKSVMNALIGIAVHKGIIGNVNDQVGFVNWINDDRNDITWNHLLQMNSGIKWTEDYGTISEATRMLYEESNMVDYVLSLPLEQPPGQHWEYSSGSSNLLSGGLRYRLNNDDQYWNFPYENLCKPLGMSTMLMEPDAAGNFVASSYSWATARDWSKFGQLYLDDGMVNGERLLPEGWVSYTVNEAAGSNGKYGAQFWLQNDDEYPDVPTDMFFADGFQGQRIFIIPSEGLVIVRLGLSKEGQPDYNKLISEIISAVE